MATWTESHEAVVAEQSWLRMEQDRHQRLLYQLKAELRALRGRERPLVTTKPETNSAIEDEPKSELPKPVNDLEEGSTSRTPVRTRSPIKVRQRSYGV